MKIRNRIKDFRLVPSKELRPNPKNWRSHPPSQRNALKGILAEVGIADAVLARELEDGTLILLDGHLRTEVLPDQEVPVLVLDVTAEEADKILLTHDAITDMAEIDEEQFELLMESVHFESDAVEQMLHEMMGETPDDETESEGSSPPEKSVPEILQIIVTCRDIDQQGKIYERLTAEGLECKLANL